jgi:hypothetical protein
MVRYIRQRRSQILAGKPNLAGAIGTATARLSGIFLASLQLFKSIAWWLAVTYYGGHPDQYEGRFIGLIVCSQPFW